MSKSVFTPEEIEMIQITFPDATLLQHDVYESHSVYVLSNNVSVEKMFRDNEIDYGTFETSTDIYFSDNFPTLREALDACIGYLLKQEAAKA